LRPIEGGDREPTVYQAHPRSGWTTRTEATPAVLFYEGQPFEALDPADRIGLDITLVGGRVPLSLQNGTLFENIFDGFALSKNNIQLGNLSNLNLFYFLSLGQTQGGLTLAEKREQRKNVMGLGGDADWYEYFIEAAVAGSYANGRVGPERANLDRAFGALSVTRQFGSVGGITVRALGNTGNDSAGAGGLFILETWMMLRRAQAYANFFGATSDFLPASVEGSAISREGILFTFDRLVAFPSLNPRVRDSAGGVFGVVLFPKSRVTVTPEIGFLVDNDSTTDNDQYGAALQFQSDIAYLVLPQGSLKPLQTRGLLYGLLVRLTLLGIENKNDATAGNRFVGGERFEVVYRF